MSNKNSSTFSSQNFICSILALTIINYYKKISEKLHEREESKYSAEEKAVLSEEEEEAFKKSVREKRQAIEKRLSEERRIPASTQRHEIVQEISSLKRQSLVEDKVKDGEFEEKPRETQYDNEPSITTKTTETSEKDKVKTKTTITTTTVSTTKDLPQETTKTKKVETVEIVKTTEQPETSELEQKLANQKLKLERTEEEKPQITTTITTTTVETRTKELDTMTHKPEDSTAQERRDSALFEGVTHELEKLDSKKKPTPMPKATEGKYYSFHFIAHIQKNSFGLFLKSGFTYLMWRPSNLFKFI